MANRRKSLSWREVSTRWRLQPNSDAAQEWLDKQLAAGIVSIEVIRKLASNSDGERAISKKDPDYNEELVAYAKTLTENLRSQSYGERGRVPPIDGEVRHYAAVGRRGAVPCVRVPLHGVKAKKGKRGSIVPVRFDMSKERIVLG